MTTFNPGILDRLLDSSDDDFYHPIPNPQNSDFFNMFEKIFNMKIDDLFNGLYGMSSDRDSNIIRNKSKIDDLNK